MTPAAEAQVTPPASTTETITGGPAFKITPVEAKPAAEAVVAAVTPPAAATVTTPAEPASKEETTPVVSEAPEKYALVLPTGTEAWMDPSDIAQVEVLAREQGLNNEQAQQALERVADSYAQQSATFRQQVVDDPIYGGANLVETQANARRFLDTVRPAGTPRGDAIRRILNKTGYANNLEIVSLFADTGKMMAEDKPVGRGAESGSGDYDIAERLYGKPPAA